MKVYCTKCKKDVEIKYYFKLSEHKKSYIAVNIKMTCSECEEFLDDYYLYDYTGEDDDD
jgi:hypothetical protein